MAEQETILEATGLTKEFKGFVAVKNVDLRVRRHTIHALIGPNGAGKTTCFNLLTKFLQPTRGRIVYKGDDITRLPPAEVAQLGLVRSFQISAVFPNLSVLENLEMGSYRRGRASRARNLERVTAIFPRLKERYSQFAGTLSGGEQQMLAIGRGLMSEPKLLILDEPSLGLSPILVEEMFGLIGRLNGEGLAILLVEQNVVQSLAVAHRAYVLEGGKVALSGKASELAEHPGLRKSYLGH